MNDEGCICDIKIATASIADDAPFGERMINPDLACGMFLDINNKDKLQQS